MQDIFTKIMDLIEEETDMPLLEKNIGEWLDKDKQNKLVYSLYRMASNARDLYREEN